VSALFTLTTLAEALGIAVPYAAAAVGGIWSEKSGVINIGLEGVLLTSAFSSVAAAHASGSAVVGLLAGVASGALVSVGHALVVERARVDAVLSGIALNFFAYAATRLALRGLYESSSNSPSIDAFRIGPGGAGGGALLARVVLDPVFLLALAAAAVTPWIFARTRFGLRVRAAGDNPEAARAAGVDVLRTRVLALVVSGAIAALGGVHLAFDQHRFESGMSNGRGFIALAAVVVSGWRADRALAACLAFGTLKAVEIALQDRAHGGLSYLFGLLPYVATLVVLAFAAGRSAAPRGLGKHADG
jgi:simple sugar transport system permease protein